MFKLIFFLAGLVIVILFSAFNLKNSSDISFIFVVLKDVPVFLNTLISFLVGAVFTLPFAFSVSRGKKNNKKNKTKAHKDKKETLPEPEGFMPEDNNINV